MIAKKNSRHDLEKKRIVFFQLGLLFTGSLTLAAFTYTDGVERPNSMKDHRHHQELFAYEEIKPEIEKEEVIKQEEIETEPQDETPQVLDQQTPDERSKDIDNSKDIPKPSVFVKNPGLDVGDKIVLKRQKVEVMAEEIVIPEVDAQFVGGFIEMKKYIARTVQYPDISREWNEQGKVWVAFVVEKDGSITNIEVVQGVSKALDKEAKRIVRTFPTWEPGLVNHAPVRTRVRLPINFVIAE